MRESILTIPVSEIFEPKCGCPICRMRDMLEQRTIEYIMGAAMMRNLTFVWKLIVLAFAKLILSK